MDTAIQTLIVVLLPLTNFLVIRHSKNWLNPLTIISVCFFVPLAFSLSRLSALQSSSWDPDTYVVIIVTIMFWVIFPTIYLLLQDKREQDTSRYAAELNHFLTTTTFRKAARIFASAVGLAYLSANLIQAGTPLPFLKPDIALKIHAEFPPVIRLIARANPAAIALLFISYFYGRKQLDLFLLITIFLLPLSRLSRIDPFISSVMLLILNWHFPIVRFKRRQVAAALMTGLLVAVLGMYLGNQRTNRFGKYEVKYEDAILWKPKVTGPLSVLPSLYGFFPLSFENFDVYVRMNKLNRTYGLQSFDWLFTGIFKVNILRSFSELQSGDIRFKPVSSGATVPTALSAFYADFGPAGSALPLFFYMLVWLEFYRRAARSPIFAVLFALASGGFALTTFQAVIVSPLLVQQLIELVVVFYLVRRLVRSPGGHADRSAAE